ncbi:hypothetical protein LINPERHAP1_LOCUS40550, partial [Linum perenne]
FLSRETVEHLRENFPNPELRTLDRCESLGEGEGNYQDRFSLFNFSSLRAFHRPPIFFMLCIGIGCVEPEEHELGDISMSRFMLDTTWRIIPIFTVFVYL